GPPNDIYCIIEEPSKHYFTEKVSHTRKNLIKFYLFSLKLSKFYHFMITTLCILKNEEQNT
ncbi:hypothetical protein, partial [Anaerotignum faecicola]